jgi:hypothetical protein
MDFEDLERLVDGFSFVEVVDFKDERARATPILEVHIQIDQSANHRQDVHLVVGEENVAFHNEDEVSHFPRSVQRLFEDHSDFLDRAIDLAMIFDRDVTAVILKDFSHHVRDHSTQLPPLLGFGLLRFGLTCILFGQIAGLDREDAAVIELNVVGVTTHVVTLLVVHPNHDTDFTSSVTTMRCRLRLGHEVGQFAKPDTLVELELTALGQFDREVG